MKKRPLEEKRSRWQKQAWRQSAQSLLCGTNAPSAIPRIRSARRGEAAGTGSDLLWSEHGHTIRTGQFEAGELTEAGKVAVQTPRLARIALLTVKERIPSRRS